MKDCRECEYGTTKVCRTNKPCIKYSQFKPKNENQELLYTLVDIVKFPYGSKFENIETGTIYVMEQQLKIIKNDGEYDYPALDEDSFEELYRVIN